MRKIVEIKFGSHLYGTATEQSDLDIKGVFIPPAQDILLQRVAPVITNCREKAEGEKNSSGDVDWEAYSLQRYLSLLAEGQTVALDMLFAPDWALLRPPDPVWIQVQALAPNILTKGAMAFVRYCRQQANKYGIKGSRVAASRIALKTFQQAEARWGAKEKVEKVAEELFEISTDNEFLGFSNGTEPNGHPVTFFEVCGKKIMMRATIDFAHKVARNLVDGYGQRALAAEQNRGVDWKALSHAVRVGHEALEFYSTGRITFPRLEASRLLAIKQGRFDYAKVGEEIESLLERVEGAVAQSGLPEKADLRLIDEFVARVYAKEVVRP